MINFAISVLLLLLFYCKWWIYYSMILYFTRLVPDSKHFTKISIKGKTIIYKTFAKLTLKTIEKCNALFSGGLRHVIEHVFITWVVLRLNLIRMCFFFL